MIAVRLSLAVRFARAACLLALVGTGPFLRAQTAEDGIMLSRDKFCTGVFFTYDTWRNYWEGPLNRSNGNLGTVTTRTALWTGNYGVTNRLNVLATTPYVWTRASQGVLHGQSGFQDLSLAAKYKLVSLPVGHFGALRALAVLSGSIPMTNYTPDLQPLSLGNHGKRIAGRVMLNYLGRKGLYVNATTAYTLRGNVTLDRSSYYTNGHLYLSNQVAIPNQFDYAISTGYRKNDITLIGNFEQQQTRGGGDIRRQDMPFVSDRVNFSKAGVTLTYPLPRVPDLGFWFIYSNTFKGRNVAQSNTYTTGLLYTFNFERRTRP